MTPASLPPSRTVALLVGCNLAMFAWLRTEQAQQLRLEPGSMAYDLLAERWSAAHLLLGCVTHLLILHLLFNIIALWTFASLCAWRFRWHHWLLLYWGSGLAGTLANNLLTPALAIGASGALSGIIGWYGAYAWRFRHRLQLAVPFVPGARWSMTARNLLIGFVALNCAGLVLQVPALAFGAHLGGTAFGAAMARIMFVRDRIRPQA